MRPNEGHSVQSRNRTQRPSKRTDCMMAFDRRTIRESVITSNCWALVLVSLTLLLPRRHAAQATFTCDRFCFESDRLLVRESALVTSIAGVSFIAGFSADSL